MGGQGSTMEQSTNKSMAGGANMNAKNFEKVKIMEKNERLSFILSLGKLLDYDKYQSYEKQQDKFNNNIHKIMEIILITERNLTNDLYNLLYVAPSILTSQIQDKIQNQNTDEQFEPMNQTFFEDLRFAHKNLKQEIINIQQHVEKEIQSLHPNNKQIQQSKAQLEETLVDVKRRIEIDILLIDAKVKFQELQSIQLNRFCEITNTLKSNYAEKYSVSENLQIISKDYTKKITETKLILQDIQNEVKVMFSQKWILNSFYQNTIQQKQIKIKLNQLFIKIVKAQTDNLPPINQEFCIGINYANQNVNTRLFSEESLSEWIIIDYEMTSELNQQSLESIQFCGKSPELRELTPIVNYDVTQYFKVNQNEQSRIDSVDLQFLLQQKIWKMSFSFIFVSNSIFKDIQPLKKPNNEFDGKLFIQLVEFRNVIIPDSIFVKSQIRIETTSTTSIVPLNIVDDEEGFIPRFNISNNHFWNVSSVDQLESLRITLFQQSRKSDMQQIGFTEILIANLSAIYMPFKWTNYEDQLKLNKQLISKFTNLIEPKIIVQMLYIPNQSTKS